MAATIRDMNTAEGMAAHMQTLPTENLRSIAARPIFLTADGGNVLLVAAAECELIIRGER
jgi:hypothetical protein